MHNFQAFAESERPSNGVPVPVWPVKNTIASLIQQPSSGG